MQSFHSEDYLYDGCVVSSAKQMWMMLWLNYCAIEIATFWVHPCATFQL